MLLGTITPIWGSKWFNNPPLHDEPSQHQMPHGHTPMPAQTSGDGHSAQLTVRLERPTSIANPLIGQGLDSQASYSPSQPQWRLESVPEGPDEVSAHPEHGARSAPYFDGQQLAHQGVMQQETMLPQSPPPSVQQPEHNPQESGPTVKTTESPDNSWDGRVQFRRPIPRVKLPEPEIMYIETEPPGRRRTMSDSEEGRLYPGQRVKPRSASHSPVLAAAISFSNDTSPEQGTPKSLKPRVVLPPPESYAKFQECRAPEKTAPKIEETATGGDTKPSADPKKEIPKKKKKSKKTKKLKAARKIDESNQNKQASKAEKELESQPRAEMTESKASDAPS